MLTLILVHKYEISFHALCNVDSKLIMLMFRNINNLPSE